MKILIATGIYPPSVGGPATYSKLLNDELPHHDIGVKIVSFDEVRHLPKIIRHVVYFFRLLKRGKKVDIIYAQDPVSVGLPAWLASRLLKKKFILKIVGDYAWEQGKQRFGVDDELDIFATRSEYSFGVRLLKKIQTKVAEAADTIVVPSEYLKKIVTLWGIDDTKIQVVYNAFSPIEVISTKEELRRKHHLQGRVLISAGRLVPWKGFVPLISVMHDLFAKIPDGTLLIAGDGPLKDELDTLIRYHRLQGKVRLMGQLSRDELGELIKASDLFVLNTGYEGLSHMILEVLALGTPVVTTNIGGNPEIIEDGKEGLLVRYNHHHDILEAIEKVLLDENVRNELIAGGVKKVKGYSKEKMIQGILKIFKKTLHG